MESCPASVLVAAAQGLCRNRNEIGCAQFAIVGKQRYVVSNAGGGDEFIGRIASKIQPGGIARDVKRDRPYAQASDRASEFEFAPTEVQFDAPVLLEIGQLPKREGRNGPGVLAQQAPLGRFEVS